MYSIAVAEPVFFESFARVRFQFQQIVNRHRLAVGGAERVLDVEFILGEIAFEFEWGKIHRLALQLLVI